MSPQAAIRGGYCGGRGVGGLGRTNSGRLWATIVFSLMTACTGGEGGTGRAEAIPVAVPPTVRDSAGVRIVENQEPQWATGTEWRVEDLLLSIGEASADPNYELFTVLDATRLSDGTIAVGNSSSGEIRFFGPDGTFIRTVGSTGGGPGEFRGANAIRALRRVEGDTLITWDIYGQLVSVFAPDGEIVRSFRLNGPAKQHFFTGLFADRSLLMHVYERTWEGPRDNMPEGVLRRNISLHHYGVDHDLANSILDTPDSDWFQAKWGPAGMMSASPPFGRRTSINAGGDRIYIATGDANEISVLNRSGGLEMSIRRVGEPVEVTSEMVSQDRDRRAAEQAARGEDPNLEPRAARMIAELPYPPILPPYGETILDSELNLWVQEYRVSADAPNHWSVFDVDGVWLGRTTLPERLHIFEIGSDYLLALTWDEMEVERVVVYGIEKPQG